MGSTAGNNLETRSLFDEIRSYNKHGGLFDLGHPLLNRVAESFVKAAGIGAAQAVSREAYFITLDSAGFDSSSGVVSDVTGTKKQRLPDLRGETSRKSLEAMVKNTGKESLQWAGSVTNFRSQQVNEPKRRDILLVGITDIAGQSFSRLAAGMYSGLTYGLREARGSHDWKNSAVAGAITGAALALTSDDASHEQIVQCAITGAAISAAANMLTGIF